MNKKLFRHLFAMPVCLTLLLYAYVSKENAPDASSSDSDTLTWAGWGSGYKDFLTGRATAARKWEDTMNYVKRYIHIGMLCTAIAAVSYTDIHSR